MNKLLIIGGPTGIGKSEVAVRLAKRYNGIVIGADSMQIYKGMDIGTGKIRQEEMDGIFHAMIDIVEPDTEYSVQKYCQDAKHAIAAAHAGNRLPIVVGGTGLYIHALLNEQNFADATPDPKIREKYWTIYREQGASHLHDLLQKVDERSAEQIAVNDVKRCIRALEIYEQTGRGKSETVASGKCSYDVSFYVLQTEREQLYAKINRRVDHMFQSGLIDEVQNLQPFWDCHSMQAIGYKEVIAALRAGKDLDQVTDEIKQNSRRYAKRQITFFKWIPFPKVYVAEDFYQNITKTSDTWWQ